MSDTPRNDDEEFRDPTAPSDETSTTAESTQGVTWSTDQPESTQRIASGQTERLPAGPPAGGSAPPGRTAPPGGAPPSSTVPGGPSAPPPPGARPPASQGPSGVGEQPTSPYMSQPQNPYGQRPAENPYGRPSGGPPPAPPGGGQPPYAGAQPPYAGAQPPYAGAQPPYTGGQPPYAGGQPPYAGGPPQPGYGYGPGPYATPGGTNGSALALTIVSGVSLVFGLCLTAIPALILGIMALAKQSTSPADSAKFARWGWIAYVIGVLLYVLAIIGIIAFFATAASQDGMMRY